ncbi:hypothetical protein NLM33_41925 [Bradyrhizobium sp. CCGUVB1N3]|uniref:hypothetical protein n=1 Tax=Bradyrhizobium sp. CCGUVB1N3 TaxID=2949629 RepID=UPI0020B198FE|nr:hypothetical protein [Bradyrhizobium sp. CCGUVB1N3]MCP3476724.1 hypothetical protein [Bradyrhizobium sp. CCGUVB1N3]
MIEADPRVSTPPLNSSASNIIDLSTRSSARPAAPMPPITTDPDDLDRASKIMRAAVKYGEHDHLLVERLHRCCSWFFIRLSGVWQLF